MEDGVNEKGLAVGLTSVFPSSIRPELNAGILLRFFLEKCQTTGEVLQYLSRLPISSAQTFTIADPTGEIAVAECYSKDLQVIRPTIKQPYVCAANIFHTPRLAVQNYTASDTWEAEPRYETLLHTLKEQGLRMGPQEAKDLLSGKSGFLCQYDRKTGKDTVWSVLYDLTKRQIFRAEGNPSRRKFKEDFRFPF